MSTSNARAAVQRGAAFLDARHPLWFDHINKENLDLASARKCILGQLYGLYGKGLSALGINESDGELNGFCEDTEWTRRPAYTARELTSAWIEVINQRKDAIVSVPLTEANRPISTDTGEVLFEGVVTINGNRINMPPVTLDYLTKFVEANR